VPIGAPGEFTYQTVKVGQRGGQVYVEAHEDIYGKTPAMFREAMTQLQRRGMTAIDPDKLERGLDEAGGIPFPVSRGRDDAQGAERSVRRKGDDGATDPHQVEARDG
jgi:hypothetical protein